MKRTYMKSSRRNTGPDKATRVLVIERAKGRCERCGWLLCELSWECHHRQLRSRGGGHGAENLVALDADCHRWVHAQPTLATTAGLMVSQYQNPALIALHPIGGPAVWLTDFGTYSPCPPKGDGND